MKLFKLTHNEIYYINHLNKLNLKQKILLFIHCIFNLNVILNNKLDQDYTKLLSQINSFLIVS